MQTTLPASYTGHYRRGLIALLGVLEFRSNNTAHRPVIETLELIGRYAKAGNLTSAAHGVIAGRGQPAVWARQARTSWAVSYGAALQKHSWTVMSSASSPAMVATGTRVPRTHGTRNDTGPLVTLRSPARALSCWGIGPTPHVSGWECPSRRGAPTGLWQAGVDPRPGTAQIHHCEQGKPALAPITSDNRRGSR